MKCKKCVLKTWHTEGEFYRRWVCNETGKPISNCEETWKRGIGRIYKDKFYPVVPECPINKETGL